MEIDGCVKWLHRLLIVSFSIKLEDLDHKFWHIFEFKLESDRLLNLKDLPIGIFELENDLVLNSLEFIWAEVISQVNQALVSQVNLYFLFD
jgi:hypothetical protein